jgi:hypothetical protein
VKNIVSDDFCDEVVTLCFRALPAMDADELAAFVNTFLALANREVLRAVRDARTALFDAKVCEN